MVSVNTSVAAGANPAVLFAA
jgi:hypothetical protein